MSRITLRQAKLIKLLSSNNGISGKNIASSLGYSLRTIQYEISEINKQFNIIDSNKDGYFLNNNYKNFKFEVYEDKYDFTSLIIKLIIEDQSLLIDDILDEYYISASSFARKLKEIDTVLHNFNLEIVKHKGYISINGNEKDKRNLINYLLNKESENEFNRYVIDYSKHLKTIDIDNIKTIVLNTINDYNYQIKKAYMHGLMSNIHIALYRSRTNHNLDDDIVNGNEGIEYEIACKIYDQYANVWNYSPTKTDIQYLTNLLQGQLEPINYNNNYVSPTILSDDFVNTINTIVTDVFKYYKINIVTKDFIYNFALHVNGLIIRCQNKQNIRNELLDNIKMNCPFIYDVSVALANRIKKEFNIEISDEEIAFISVHIGFLIENDSDYKSKVSILLLTSNYKTISASTKDKLLSTYGNEIEIFEDITDIEKNNIDLIICNRAYNILGKRMIIVSPFYDDNDKKKIDEAINQCILEKEIIYQDLVLNTFFKQDLFFKIDYQMNKFEAIDFLCEKLKDKDIVDDNFKQSVLDREASSSTCFFKSFAIPHAEKFLSKKTRFAILISKPGIMWDNELIHMVLIVAIKFTDRKIFMSIYNTIVRALQSKEKVNILTKSNSITEFIDTIRNS